MKSEKLKIKPKWVEKGVGLVIAHPDDESLMWGLLELLTEAKVPVIIISLTWGELGSVAGQSHLSPAEVKMIRHREFAQAVTQLGASQEVLGFGDFNLALEPFSNLALPLLNLLRQKDLAAIFTFHPFEITPDFDHPDHNVAGEAARFAATGQDIKNLITEQPATATRPELYFWTTNPDLATHKLKLKEPSKKSRVKYLSQNYPSQFPAPTKKRWGTIFDRIATREYYQRVR